MNLVKSEKRAPTLTPAQKALVALIINKYKAGTQIILDEVRPIYKLAMRESEHYMGWRDDDGVWQERRRPYTEQYMKDKATQWLLRNLGSLIKKGYLTVIPRISLSDKPALRQETA